MAGHSFAYLGSVRHDGGLYALHFNIAREVTRASAAQTRSDANVRKRHAQDLGEGIGAKLDLVAYSARAKND